MKLLRAMTILATLMAAMPAHAFPYRLSYGGRLQGDSGRPLSGPVDLKIIFYRDATTSTPIGVTPPSFNGVALESGIFALSLEFTPEEFHTLFAQGLETWIQVENLTHQQTYPRQKFSAVPFALRVPLDEKSLVRDADGKITLGALTQLPVKASAETFGVTFKAPAALAENYTLTLPVSSGSNGEFLQSNASGQLSWVSADVGTVGGLARTNNLSELSSSAASARSNLGLGTAATRGVGTGAGDVAAGNHTHVLAALTDDGALAAKNTVGANDLADGSLDNAHFAAGAAIDVGKIAGLGDAALKEVGTGANDVAAGAHTHTASQISGLGVLATVSSVTATELGATKVTNAKINSAAAIAGSKVDPQFGAQAVTTTGTLAAARLTSTGEVKVGTTALTCDASLKGALRYGSGNVMEYCNGSSWKNLFAADTAAIERTPPVGALVAWHKSLSNTPAIPSGWVECNGQVLNDAASPYNGQTLPNLNSATQNGSTSSGMFLRGATTSGNLEADATVKNNLSGTVRKMDNWWDGDAGSASNTTIGKTITFVNFALAGDAETRPANMTVVWIMRVK